MKVVSYLELLPRISLHFTKYPLPTALKILCAFLPDCFNLLAILRFVLAATFTIQIHSTFNLQADHSFSMIDHQVHKENMKIPERSRKPSVFCVAGRMLNNLMGRNSLPPELPSTVVSKSNPSSPVPQSEGVFSFKKVFKKRSV